MKCPFCEYLDSKVIDSRPTEDGGSIRRRRECLECKKRFTTYEKIETIPLIVVKKNGDRESFDRSKILNGLIKSCEKRPISIQTLENVTDKIENDLQKNSKKEISSQVIGEEIMRELKHLDEVAYVRFASVYRQFKDINTFMNELKSILEEKSK